MARPRVFVSSTYYDLKHIRASLCQFIESLGFEPVLFERGNISYSPDIPLADSCYADVEKSDIFVLIIGGRYGTASIGDNGSNGIDSITKREYLSAIKNGIPAYILIESLVHSEYTTYEKNCDSENKVSYAYVDDERVYHFMKEIYSQKQNNPVHPFENVSDIENWLREQWAGLFRDLLVKRNQSNELKSMSLQIGALQEISKTLKTYIESLLESSSSSSGSSGSSDLIDDENKRLKNAELRRLLEANVLIGCLIKDFSIPYEEILDVIEKSSTVEEFLEIIKSEDSKSLLHDNNDFMFLVTHINEARKILSLQPLTDKFEDYNGNKQ